MCNCELNEFAWIKKNNEIKAQKNSNNMYEQSVEGSKGGDTIIGIGFRLFMIKMRDGILTAVIWDI